MKPKQKPALLYPSKPRATQRRNSLQRIKDEATRRKVQILLSPLPHHFLSLKTPRKSITNFSPRKSITPQVFRRDSQQIDVNERANQSPNQVVIAKSPRKRIRRKNEAEKLLEELHSKKFVNEGGIPGPRRTLRNRLVLTPKSPHVRVKRISRQSTKSRKLSPTSLNKFLSRDVVIELERCAEYETATSKPIQKEVPATKTNQDIDGSRAKPFVGREFSIVLEKLPFVEPERVDRVASKPALQAEATTSGLESSSKVVDAPKIVVREGLRVLLEKLPDPTPRPVDEKSREQIADSTIQSEADNVSISELNTDERSKEPVTPSRDIVSEHVASPVTPAATTAPLSTPISSPAQVTEVSGKKTPKSIDIPLRQVTIMKSRFTKMNRALESSTKPTPIKVRPNSTYLFSPSVRSPTSAIKFTKTKAPESPSRLESSGKDPVLSASSTSSTVRSGGLTSILKSSKATPSPRHGSLLPVFTPRSRLDTGNASRASSKSVKYLDKSHRIEPVKKSSHESESVIVKRLSKKSAGSVVETHTRVESQSAESPPTSQSTILCTEAVSPLSRGQLLTQKSLAASPNPLQILLIKSPKAVRTPKRDDTQGTGEKTPAKSPMNRGRLLMEQSLADSPKQPDVSVAGKEVRRSVSFSSILNRSHSDSSSGRKEPKDVSYKQKWSSAGDLLKMSIDDRDQKSDESDSNKDLSPIATPLDSSPNEGVFSNAKTCAAILSTLKTSDKRRSKSTPDNLSQTKSSEVARSLQMPAKTSKVSSETSSSSQPDLTRKLSEVVIDPTKQSVPQPLKKTFHIPKLKPGLPTADKTPKALVSSLPRSGFTPSPPTKSSLTQSVLGSATYLPRSHSASTYKRQAPAKPSQSTGFKPPWIKSTLVSTAQTTSRSVYSPDVRTPATKPTYSSASRSPATSNAWSKFCVPYSSSTKPPYTAVPHLLTTCPPQPSSPTHSFAKPASVSYKDPRLIKSQPVATSQMVTTKPPLPTPPSAVTSNNKDPRLATHASQTIPVKQLQTPQSAVPSPKPASSAKLGPDLTKPLHIKTTPPRHHSSSKSRSGGLKVAYMGSRSSNNSCFSKYLPSGPQYSPTYSKYLQNGFSKLPDAHRASKTPKPTSPGTSNVLRWSTVKPWMVNKPKSPPKGPSGSLPSEKPNNVAAGSTAAKAVTLPTGPTGSLTTSVITSNPEYSPLCPQF